MVKRLFLASLAGLLVFLTIHAQEFQLTGRVTNDFNKPLNQASLTIIRGEQPGDTIVTKTNSNGEYQFSVSFSPAINPNRANESLYQNYPNPFGTFTVIPYRVDLEGVINISIYDIQGKLVKTLVNSLQNTGLHYILWDGRMENGRKANAGYYIAVLSDYSNLGMIRILYDPSIQNELPRIPMDIQVSLKGEPQSPVIIVPRILVEAEGYYRDSVTNYRAVHDGTGPDFSLRPVFDAPYRVDENFFYVQQSPDFVKLMIKGVNLGVAKPGKSPGEILDATEADYTEWFEMMQELGLNSIRIYTLHGPQFYRSLARHNSANPTNPLYLFQGIWLRELESSSSSKDLYTHTVEFTNEIETVIDCLYGNRSVPVRPGKAYGDYTLDCNVSQWVIGFIIGREVSPYEIAETNKQHPLDLSYHGSIFSLSASTPSESWVAEKLEYTIQYLRTHYQAERPISFSSWPTLDPLTHPSETSASEDKESFDMEKLDTDHSVAGYFATYHAYPYYPNFISTDPGYKTFSDRMGPNSYLGYLTDLKNHYSQKPLLIGEFGVPSSWGNAHFSQSLMHHGDHSEEMQGKYAVRMFENIFTAGCAGGIVFSWLDEWFKSTWIVLNQESYGYYDDQNRFIVTRPLWHNLTSAEQNFGLIGFEPVPPLPTVVSGTANCLTDSVLCSSDARFFTIQVFTRNPLTAVDTLWVAFDTYDRSLGESILPNGKTVSNRAEFALRVIPGLQASLYVTESYNMRGFTPRFNLTGPKQLFRSVVSDGAPWRLVEWINDEASKAVQSIGTMSVHKGLAGSSPRDGVIFDNRVTYIRIPWTLLQISDPTRLEVVHYEGPVIHRFSDGIAITLMSNSCSVTCQPFSWNGWTTIPEYTTYRKQSFNILKEGFLKGTRKKTQTTRLPRH